MIRKRVLYPVNFCPTPPTIKCLLRNAFIHSNYPDFPQKPRKAAILSTKLIKSFFGKGWVREARAMFDEMPDRDVVAWTAIISGYASRDCNASAWECFCEMLRSGTVPNQFTMSSVLMACRGMRILEYGALLHGLVVKRGMQGSSYVDNALMDMYSACSTTMDDACAVFRDLKEKSDVMWTTLITGFTHQGDGCGGLKIFKHMLLEEAEVTPYCLTIAARACTSIGLLTVGKQIHAFVMKHGFQSNLPVMNSILDMYCRCGSVSEANQYFHEMEERDLITWNTIIAGFEGSPSSESLLIFSRMKSEGFSPDYYTFASVIAACADLAALNCGQQVHAGLFRRGFHRNLTLANALIDMYAKCGTIADSHKIFSEMTERNLVSWTSMMIGYGAHGYGNDAVDLFEEMVKSGTRPDRIVSMAVLSACSHSGLIDEGLKCFRLMTSDYKITPDQEIYGCVVDLLGRAGRVEEAYKLIESLPFKPDESMWVALLGACKAHGFTNLGNLAARRVLDLKPKRAGTYAMVSYIYAAEGKWGQFAKVRKLMRGIGNKKEAGQSWIEVQNQVYSFVVGDKMGPNIEGVYSALDLLVQHMKEAGYVPDLDCLIHNQETRT